MNNAGPGGFAHAPITKFLVVASAGVSLLGHFLHKTSAFCLSIQGVASVYFFRVFERQWGSRKYGAFVLFSTVANTITELGLLAMLRDRNVGRDLWASGPNALIFSCLVQYYFDTPVSVRFRTMGVTLSDKGFVYVLVGQMIFLNKSLLPSLVGIAAGIVSGLLYRSGGLPFYDMAIPVSVAKACNALFGPFFVSSGPSPAQARLLAHSRAQQRMWNQGGGGGMRRPIPRGGTAPNQGTGVAPTGGDDADAAAIAQGYTDTLIPDAPEMAGGAPPWGLYARGGAARASRPTPIPPNQEAVAQLVAMGFSETAVENALRVTNNDINRATNILLDQSN